MRAISPVIFAMLFVCFAAVSCKHTKPAAKTQPSKQPMQDITAVGPDGGQMTAEKASEEEIFVQGCIEKSLGNNRKALLKFQECLDMNPNNAAANYELAGLYREEGQKDRALKYAQVAANLNPANRWYSLRYAELLQENGRHEEATKIFKEISEREPDNTDLLYRYAASLRRAGRNDEALNMYARIQVLDGISDTLVNCRIAAYRAKNDLAGEEKALLELIAAKPGEINTYYRLADFYNENQQGEKGEAIYRKMTSEFPYLATPRLKLASAYADKGATDKAFIEAVRAFELPASIEEKAVYMQRRYPVSDSASTLSAIQKKEADSLCRILRRMHPDKAQAYSMSGNYLYADGKLKEAREQYRKAVNIDGDSYEPWKRILLINDKMKDYAAQEKDCKTVLELYTTQPEPYYYLGLINYNRKEYKKAIPDLESSMDYTYGNPAFDLAVKVMLIKAYRETGNADKADTYSEEVMRKDSSYYEVINGYCASLAAQHIKLYSAEQMMMRVVEKEPGNASYLGTLAWIEYQMNDYKIAKAWMEKAISKSPDDALINERMGDIEYRLGNMDSALKYWKKSKDKGGSNPALERKISSKKMLDTE